MLTLIYALAISTTVGDYSDCIELSAGTTAEELQAFNDCMLAQPPAPSVSASNSHEIDLYTGRSADLQAKIDRHEAEYQHEQLRMALEQQRLERHLAEMQRITARVRGLDATYTFTARDNHGTMWRIFAY